MGFVEAIEVKVAKLSVELSQVMILPINPDSVSVPALAPVHKTIDEPETEPPTAIPSTVMVKKDEVAVEHVPFWIIALKLVVVVKFTNPRMSLVEGIGVEVTKLSTELSQVKIVPLNPETVRLPEFAPLQRGV